LCFFCHQVMIRFVYLSVCLLWRCPETRLSDLIETKTINGGFVKLEFKTFEHDRVASIKIRVQDPYVGSVEFQLDPKYREDIELQEQIYVRAMREIKNVGGRHVWESCVTERTRGKPVTDLDWFPAYGAMFDGKFEYRKDGVHETLPYASGYTMDIPENLEQLLF